MGAIFAACYRRQANPTISVPAPRDGRGDPWWYDHLAAHLSQYATAGYTHLLLPPVHLTIGSDTPGADGYGVFDDYGLGTKQRPTRFGYERRLRRLTAMCHANGITPMADWVPHQRFGGRGGRYRYEAFGGKDLGRFPKDPGCFRGPAALGMVPQDPVPDPFWDFAFGDELCPVNGVPAGYVQDELNKAGDWLFRSLDLGGCRNDDTKGQATSAVRKWTHYGAMAGKPIIGEYAEGNKLTLKWWLDQFPPNVMTYDFEIKYRLRDMANNTARWDMRRLQWSGLASLGYGHRAVTFVENPDSDTNGFGAVVYNKLLAYAFILASEGWASVYYRDYAEDRYCYGLKPRLDNLLWIRNHLAHGPTVYRHAEYQFIVLERQGAPGLLVGLNNDSWGPTKYVTVQTSFGAHQPLHDYTGLSPLSDVWTDQYGRVTIALPPNDNGTGYCMYSHAGISTPNVTTSRSTTQLFEGASDLLRGPALPDGNEVGEIWCAPNTDIFLANELNPEVQFELRDPNGDLLLDRGTATGRHTRTTHEGGHRLTAFAPAETPYQLLVTFTAPTTLKGV